MSTLNLHELIDLHEKPPKYMFLVSLLYPKSLDTTLSASYSFSALLTHNSVNRKL